MLYCEETISQACPLARRINLHRKFIDTGLWSLARHPNYGGEIALWCGAFLASASALRGPALLAAAASPAFVALLLLKVSGVPLLDKSAAKRWGKDPAYLVRVTYRLLDVVAPPPCLTSLLPGRLRSTPMKQHQT